MAELRRLVLTMLAAAICAIAIAGQQRAAADRVWEPIDPSGTNAAEAEPPTLEPSTLHSIGVLWPVRGDDNGNASIAVSYRQRGSGAWHAAYPLFWIHPERQPAQYRVPGGRLFAGSVFGLEPGTAYEVRLDLTDPDGGTTSERLTAMTRAVPVLPDGMRPRYVVPDDAAGPGSGAEDDPFRGLARALNDAQPGDLFLLKAGIYPSAAVRVPRSGTEAKPIVIRGEGPKRVILDGGGGDVALDFSERSDLWLEGVTLRNATVLLRADRASRIVVRGNEFRIVLVRGAAGIRVLDTRTSHFLITDNRFLGPNTEWPMTYRRKRLPELINGITIAGSGHDIAYNEISHVGDGINTGQIIDNNPAGSGIASTDIYNNDIDETRTECIEADYALTNVRVHDNRLTNCLYGVSAQPALGGPLYIFRNMIFNTHSGPVKLHNHTSGVLMFHNTSVRAGYPLAIFPGGETVNDVVSRNNLFIGTEGPAIRATGRMKRSDFDNDGFAYRSGGGFALWNGTVYHTPLDAKDAGIIYATHGPIMLMGEGELETGPRPPAGALVAQPREENRPRLSAASRALDKGIRLPNLNDMFTGEAPDLGCCERGVPLPRVGPRPDWRGGPQR